MEGWGWMERRVWASVTDGTGEPYRKRGMRGCILRVEWLIVVLMVCG